MSNRSVTPSIINETREVFESILKEAVSIPNQKMDVGENPTSVSPNETDNESNKSFLMRKFLQNSKEFNAVEPVEVRPVPKPRRSKSSLARKVGAPGSVRSASSQKTYIVENLDAKASNTDIVEVMAYTEKPKASSSVSKSLKGSTNSGNRAIKSQEEVSISSTTSEKQSSLISGKESETSNEKPRKSQDSKYTYEKIVEIVIHKADDLQLDSYVTHPTVKVHIVDINTGKYYSKSDKSRSVVFYYENDQQDYILPVMTASYNLQENRTFSPQWEESILLNEDFTYLINEDVVMFFEVLDYVPAISKKLRKLQKYCYKGWHRIAFAFLKVVSKCEALNTNKRVKLQLFHATEIKKWDPSTCDLWYAWKANKLKLYPSALHVTITEVLSPKKVVETFRSKTPLQKESVNTPKQLVLVSRKSTTDKELSKYSKEAFDLPNKPLAELECYESGCLVFKFSNNGLYLACAVENNGGFCIVVYEVNTFEEIYSANEHTGLIYSINWSLDDSLVITASADCTVVIWNFSTSSFVQMLPHPIYVYASNITGDKTIIATAGYDSIIRIWFYNKDETMYDLRQELEKHRDFITSICFNSKSTYLYSSDSTGCIFEWSKLEDSSWKFERDLSTPDLKNTVINEILLFPNEKKLLVHSRDSILRILSLRKACVLYWLRGALNFSIQTYCSITSCGSYVTSGSENGLIMVWHAKTGKEVATYEPFLNYFDLDAVHCVQFHPRDSIIAFSHYGGACPVLLYHYTGTKEQKKQQIVRDRKNVDPTVKLNKEENVCFHGILEKMDKLLT